MAAAVLLAAEREKALGGDYRRDVLKGDRFNHVTNTAVWDSKRAPGLLSLPADVRVRHGRRTRDEARD